jgi:hypothetical protein
MFGIVKIFSKICSCLLGSGATNTVQSGMAIIAAGCPARKNETAGAVVMSQASVGVPFKRGKPP